MRVDIIDMAVESCSWRQVEKHFLSFGYIKKPRKIDVDVAIFSPMIRKPIWRWNCETLRDLTGWKWQKAEGWNWLVEEFERQAGLVAAGVRGKIFIKFGSWWYKVEYDQIDPESFSLPCGSLVDEFYNRSSHDQDQVIKATLTVNYKKLMNLGFGLIQSSPSEGKRMHGKRVKILLIHVYYRYLRRKKWNPPKPSWILEGDTWIRRDPAQLGTPQRRQIGTPKSLFSDSNRNTTNASNRNTPRNHPGQHPFLQKSYGRWR